MKLFKLSAALCIAALPTLLTAQTPISGFMQGKGKGNVVVSYSTESYDQVFLVPKKIDGVPVFNKVTVQSTSLYSTVGLSNKVDLQFNLPSIKSTGEAKQGELDAGFQNERKGLQDLSLYVKYNPYKAKVGKGNLSLITSMGLQLPMGSYKVEEGLQSILAIGNHTTQLNTFALLQYKADKGFFVNGSMGYSLRSGSAPEALVAELKAGYAAKAFYVDAFIAGQSSSKGTDILKEGFTGVFPNTQVNYSKVGLSLYVPISKGFGAAAGFSSYVSGRNIGAASGGYGALIYSF